MTPARVEAPLVFGCGPDRLVGVISGPAGPDATVRTGVVIVVGGPQYRAGSHRQFVQLARALAAAGIPALRFDCRGMGDSEGKFESFEAVDDDIDAAIGALCAARPGLAGVVIWGLCDAASAALLYCLRRRDLRVTGLCLANPWVRSEATLARARVRHYYASRLLEAEFWSGLVSGKRNPFRALAAMLGNMRRARRAGGVPAGGYQAGMAAAWREFAGPILLLLSERDATAQEFLECLNNDSEWGGALARPNVTRCDLAGADHTFTQSALRLRAEAATCRFVLDKCGPRA